MRDKLFVPARQAQAHTECVELQTAQNYFYDALVTEALYCHSVQASHILYITLITLSLYSTWQGPSLQVRRRALEHSRSTCSLVLEA